MLQSEVRTAVDAVHLDVTAQAMWQALTAGVSPDKLMTTLETAIIDFKAVQCELPGLSSCDTQIIYDEVPEGLIDLPSAARELGKPPSLLNQWLGKGNINSYGRLKAPARGGGFHLLKMSEILEYLSSPKRRGGRPQKHKITA